MTTLTQTLYRLLRLIAPALALCTAIAGGIAAESAEAMLLACLLTALSAIWLGMAWGLED